GPEAHSQWHLDRVEVLHQPSGLQTTFPCGAWIDPAAAQPMVLQAAGTRQALAMTLVVQVYQEYEVVVHTAAAADSAFDGNVTLRLEGASGRKSQLLLLGKGGADTGLFQVASVNTVHVSAADLGHLAKAWLGLQNTGSSSSWRPSKLQVTNTVSGTYDLFLNSDMLWYHSGEVGLQRVTQTQSVGVYVYMGSGPTFEGDVYLTLYGSEGRTEEHILQRWGSSPMWNTDDYWYFDIQQAYYVGTLTHCMVRCEKRGECSQLSLDRLEVTPEKPNITSVFKWGKPLPAGKGPVRVNKLLQPADLELTVRTSDIRGAGTDADVFVAIEGDNGVLEEIRLFNSADNFSRGRTDTFTIAGVDVGDNKRFTFRLVPQTGATEAHSSWHLSEVELLDRGSGRCTAASLYSWVVPGSTAILHESRNYQALFPYTITVTTGDKLAADFSGQVYVVVTGWSGSTRELLLAPSGCTSHTFSRGEKDMFQVKAADVSYPYALDVRIVPDAASAGHDREWYLQSIEVVADDSGNSMMVEHENWVRADEPPVTLYRSVENTDYKVTVFTATSSAAAFDGELYITLHGLYGSCDENQLVAEGASLAPGSKQEYQLRDSDLDKLSLLQLRLKATGVVLPGQWTLDRVEVEHLASHTTSVFPYLRPDGSTACPPPCTDNNWTLALKRFLPHVEYQVVVVTGDAPGTSFDGQVFLTLRGSRGQAEEVLLPANPAQAFNAKQTDTFVVSAGDVGQVESVVVRIDTPSAASQWHLDCLSVRKTSDLASMPPLLLTYRSFLNAHNPSTTLYQQSSYTFNVAATTSASEPNGGFDGTVYVTLHYWWGSSAEVPLLPASIPAPDAAPALLALAAKAAALEPGNTAALCLKAFAGQPEALTLRLEPKPGGATSWHLASMTISPEYNPDAVFSLALHHWVQAGVEHAVRLPLRQLQPVTVVLAVGPSQPTHFAGRLQPGCAGSAVLRCLGKAVCGSELQWQE
ncbi:hypothetical protein QJQ45_021976, partial [Haematococcus lacustris]